MGFSDTGVKEVPDEAGGILILARVTVLRKE